MVRSLRLPVVIAVLLVSVCGLQAITIAPARADVTSYDNAVRSDQPLVFYPFDENEDETTFANVMHPGDNAVSVGGAHTVLGLNPFGTDDSDGSLLFSSLGPQYAQSPPLSPLVGDSDRTVEFWFRSESPASQCLVSTGTQSHGAALSICLTDGRQFGSPTPGAAGVYVQFYDADIYLPRAELTDGLWHYLAVSVSGSTVAVDVDGASNSGYVWNGSSYSALTSQPFVLPLVPQTAVAPVQLGGPLGWMPAVFGSIDEFAVYPAALSIEDLSRHFDDALTSPRPGPPVGVTVTPHNGSVSVSWQPPQSQGASPITGYVVTAVSDYNDRLPAPPSVDVSVTADASAGSAEIGGLVADCHQRYVVTVAAANTQGLGEAATSNAFRPSGIVVAGQDPPYVVILLDGIRESQPGFTMNPYAPTLDGTPSYCPESWSATDSTEQEADFAGTPNGPWSFFHKWNFGEVDNPLVGVSDGAATGDQESTPRALPGNDLALAPGTFTHSFMLDALAAQGSIILPFSYRGYAFGPNFSSRPAFTFYGYSQRQATPGLGPTVQQDAALLGSEVRDAATAWPGAEIVVMGHSQGGLIAFTWWHCAQGRDSTCGGLRSTLPSSFLRAYSLDSPINGACAESPVVSFGCGGPPSYPPYQLRQLTDPLYLAADAARGESFRFIGSYGDSPVGGYQSGAKTLEHQLLFPYSSNLTYDAVESACSNASNESSCPAPSPPDHISECPVDQPAPWEVAHYVEKYCPGDVAYFDNSLGLNY